MAAIGEKEIKALIRSGDIGGAFLLFGTESYLKEFYSSKLKDKVVSPDFADFNYHFFDGVSCTLEDIEQAVEAFPMMSSNTCVFVKDMAVDSLDEDSYEKLEKIVSDVPDYCTLIFYIGKADSLKKTAKAKKAVSLFTKYGNAVYLIVAEELIRYFDDTLCSQLLAFEVETDSNIVVHLLQSQQ